MGGIIFLSSWIGVTLFDYGMILYRKTSTNKQIIDILEQNGYELDNRYKHLIREKIFQLNNFKLDDEEVFCAIDFFPLLNLFHFFVDMPRVLLGHHNYLDGQYDFCIDNCLDESVIDELKNKGLIIGYNEKQIEPSCNDKELDDENYNDLSSNQNIKKELKKLYIMRKQINDMIEEKENKLNEKNKRKVKGRR